MDMDLESPCEAISLRSSTSSNQMNVNMASAGSARGPPAQEHVERPRAFVKIGQFGDVLVGGYVRSTPIGPRMARAIGPIERKSLIYPSVRASMCE